MAISTSKLKKLDNNWKKTREEIGDSTGGFETIPSGKYVAGKLQTELTEDNNGCIVILRSCTILEGEHEGFVLKERMNIDPSVSPRGQEFLLKWFNLLGYQVDSLVDDLEDTLDAINANTGATFQIQVKEKDGFNNAFYNKVLDEGEPDDAPEDDAPEDDEDDVPEEEDDAPEDTIPEMPDIDDMTTRQLKKLIKDHKLDIGDVSDMDDDDIRDAIETAWDNAYAEKATAKKANSKGTSKKVAKKAAKKVVKKAAKKAVKKNGTEEKQRKALFAIGDSFGLPVTAEQTLKELKEEFAAYEFTEDELSEEEVEVLTANGLASIIS